MDRPASIIWRRAPRTLIGHRGARLLYSLASGTASLLLARNGGELDDRLQAALGGHGYFPPIDWALVATLIGSAGIVISLVCLLREAGAILLLARGLGRPIRALGLARIVWAGQEEAWLEFDSGSQVQSFLVPSGQLDAFLHLFSEPAFVEIAWIELPESMGGSSLTEIRDGSFAHRAVA